MPILAIVAAKLAVNAAVSGRYGWHTDELYYADCGRHLAWGFVDFPPLTPIMAAAARVALGDSLIALRFVASLAGALTLVVVAALVRDLGGGRRAQVLALLATFPAVLGANAMFQTVSFDQLTWALVLWAAVRLRSGDDRRGWLLLGVAVALAWSTKYTVGVLVGCLGVGLVGTRSGRKRLSTMGVLGAAGIVVVVALPNVWWQVRHGWPSVHFFAGRNGEVRSEDPPLRFLAELLVLASPLAVPVWWAGLRRLWRSDQRHLGVAAGLVAPVWLLLGGKSYYALPAFFLLHAAGAVALVERWERAGRGGRVLPWAIALMPLLSLPMIVPALPTRTMVSAGIADARDDYAVELGWPELAGSVDGAWDDLSPAEQTRAAVLAGDYAAAGAVRRFGRADHGSPPPVLSAALSNRYWTPGPSARRATVLIAVAVDRRWLAHRCASIRRVGTIRNRWGVSNEESGGPLFLCHLNAGSNAGQAWADAARRRD